MSKRDMSRGATESAGGMGPGAPGPMPPVWVPAMVLAIVFLASGLRADDAPAVTEKNVNAAVERGVEWLKSRRNEWGHWQGGNEPGDRYWAGDSALAILALLYAGENPKTSEMDRALDWLAAQPIKATYVYGLRAHVFGLVDAAKFKKRLDGDLDWLTKALYPSNSESRGAYDYETSASAYGGRYDNSNSQFGVLGAWMATEAGERSDNLDSYWKLVEEHWLRDQNTDGGWGYSKVDNIGQASTGSMTAAGLSTLYVILDRVYARSGHRQAKHLISAIDAGMNWMSREYAPGNPHGDMRWKYYYLYGVERAGRASGRKYFRDRDWFREGAKEILREQSPEGTWPGGLHDTCFALMFLCHGRAPLLLNKLEKGEDWDNHFRDAAGLCRYANHTFEKLMNWQIVSLDGAIDDLLEAPVLYLHGTKAWEFSENETERLRDYSRRGGLLLAVCPKESKEFRESIEKLSRELFPDIRLRRLPARDPLFDGRVQFVVEPPPEVLEVHNGLRPLMLVIAEDVAAAWNRYDVKRADAAFKLGSNVYVYATDKSPVSSRLATPSIALEPVDTTRTIRVARIQYKGDWNIEPYGWQRLRTYMNNTCRTRLDVRTVKLDARELDEVKIAHISGVRTFSLPAAEIAGLRRFLTDGGTLLADAAGGSREFFDALERSVGEALKVEPIRLPGNSPILTGAGVTDALKLDKVEYRRAARTDARGHDFPPLKAFMLGSRPAVVYSPLDISVGLLGTPVYECRGYEPDSCLVVMRNLLLYAALSTGEKTRLAGGSK